MALGIPYWLSVLKLANLWGFNDLRRKAIGAISSGELSIMERLSYGRLLKVEKWVAQGYTELVDRREMMTEAEVGQIGWNAMLKICKLREEFYSLKQSASGSSSISSARLRFLTSPLLFRTSSLHRSFTRY